MRTQVSRVVLVGMLGLLGCLLGCEPEAEQTKTQIMVRIEGTDAALIGRMTHLRATASVRLQNGWRAPVQQVIPVGRLSWPVQIPVVPRDLDESQATFEVVIEALASGQVLAQARTVTSFLPFQHRELTLNLFGCSGSQAVCAAPSCHGEECAVCDPSGACIPTGYTNPNMLVTQRYQNDAGDVVIVDSDAASFGEDGSFVDPTMPSEMDGGNSEDAGRQGPPSNNDAGSAISDAGTTASDAGSDAAAPRMDASSPDAGRDAGAPITCATLSCGTNAHCVETGGSHCVCDTGFSGQPGACANTDECVGNPCGAPNTCTDGTNDYSCTCASNYIRINSKRCVAPVAKVTAGAHHTCGLRTDGTVVCWGFNSSGQLGTYEGAAVPGLTSVEQVAAGSGHTCARLTGGTVRCWGYNREGELGNGTNTDSVMPVAVSGLNNVVDISAGSAVSCAAITTGARCWGWNANRNLGNGTTADSNTPVIAGSLNNAVEVAVRELAGCARTSAGAVWCWGANNYGQGGNDTIGGSGLPIQANGITTAAQIAVGEMHVCARLSGGSVMCWGQGGQGQTGTGTSPTSPTTVPNLANITDLCAGWRHTCAVRSDGRVLCWGENGGGQVGVTGSANVSTPTLVPNLSDVTDVACGEQHSCARLSSGAVKCWGYNLYGQLGDGTQVDSTTPVTVVFR